MNNHQEFTSIVIKKRLTTGVFEVTKSKDNETLINGVYVVEFVMSK